MQHSPQQILIVDDDPFVRDMLAKNLAVDGYTILAADNGISGLQLFHAQKPAIVILDLKMSGIDGFEFLRRLRPKVMSAYSIIVVTGYPSDENIQQCYRLGIQNFLRKPINIYDLKGIIKRTFDSHRHANRIISEMDVSKRALGLLDSTFNSIVDGCIVFDDDFCVKMISRKGCQILDVKENKVLGRPVSALLGNEFAGPSGGLLRIIADAQRVRNQRAVFVTPHSKQLQVKFSASSLRNVSSKKHWVLVFREAPNEQIRIRKRYHHILFGEMASCDPEMKRIFKLIDQVAKSNANILVEGETGTGKELVAKEIHRRSKRVQGPFHAVNCAAISNNLLESEFFGHMRGAFTGASHTKPGRFELANGGSLLLDEISEIPMPLQAKLLRAIQERIFERVGGTKSIHIDVRIIATSNKDIEQMVAKGTFRADLYYRLNVVKISLPELRQRRHDIPLLVAKFIDEFNKREKRKVERLHPEAKKILLQYDWPGNIRELRHAIEYAFAVGATTEIGVDHLPQTFRKPHQSQDVFDHYALNERERILDALKKANYKKQKAAALMGVHRSTFYRKLRKHGL